MTISYIMLRFVVLLVIVCGVASRSLNGTSSKNVQRSGFDYFIFVRQWDPSICDVMRCNIRPSRTEFTIHGLWPNYNGGGYPEFCDNSRQFDAQAVDDLLPEMKREWPSFVMGGVGFWAHEWLRHGTCASSVLETEHDYFSEVLRLHEHLDLRKALEDGGLEVSSTKEYSISEFVHAFEDAFGAEPVIHCAESKDEITEVWQCVDKDLRVFDCPDSVKASSNSGSCNKMRLPPLRSSD